MQKKYEVIRLIKQNAGCHIVMDYVEGEILVFYLKNHPYIGKEQLFLWIKQIIRQLDDIQRVKGISGYGYVTPYCMIVKEDKSIALLDLNADSNASIMRNMEKHSIQSAFFPIEEGEDDFYSLGKTIQFLFAHAEATSTLTKKEERKFQKIISKCLSEHKRKSYQKISDILKDFPKENEKKKISKKNIFIIKALFLAFIIFVVGISFSENQEKEHYEVEKKQENVMEDSILFDIGLTYFVELEDYTRSWEFFRRSRNGCELGTEYKELSEFMNGSSKKNTREIEELLLRVQEIISEEEEVDVRYYKSLLKVYMRMDTEEAYKKIRELCEKILSENAWREEEEELRKLLAMVYTKSEEYEKAIEEYEILCQWNQSETIYKTLIELYERTEQEEKVLEMCQKVLKDIPYSEDINIIYLRTLCTSIKITKKETENKIKEVIEKFPELLKNKEFQKIQTEYGIKIEGGNIWIEK